jgi:hypothetical protein
VKIGCEERQLRCREARGARDNGTWAYLALVIHPLLLGASLGTMKLQHVALQTSLSGPASPRMHGFESLGGDFTGTLEVSFAGSLPL